MPASTRKLNRVMEIREIVAVFGGRNIFADDYLVPSVCNLFENLERLWIVASIVETRPLSCRVRNVRLTGRSSREAARGCKKRPPS